VVTPAAILEQHGSDATRYWAASSRLGADAAFDINNPTQLKIGRRLAIKVLNAAKFVLGFEAPEDAEVTAELDKAMLRELAKVVAEATAAFESYDHARALEVTETFFWTFCDDYLELVKERAHGAGDASGQASAVAALRLALSTLIRLFAPVIPYAAEETWSWFNEGSVHTAAWPQSDELAIAGSGPAVLAVASQALVGIRRTKTDAKVSQKTPITSLTLTGTAEQLAALRLAEDDLKAVGRIAAIEYVQCEGVAVRDAELGDLS
jgi:valyl-tRNA synthetase